MIGVRLYAVPLHDGAALVVPEGALQDLRGAGHVLEAYPGPARIDVLVPDATAAHTATYLESASLLVRRAAVLATLPRGGNVIGPHGGWAGALIAAGWLLVLFAGQSGALAACGLWLALALPWLRRHVSRRLVAGGGRAATGLRSLERAPVRCLEHAGLSHLIPVLRDPSAPPAERYREAALRCGAAGLSWLSPFYQALAAGELPDLLWLRVPATAPADPQAEVQAATEATGHTGAPGTTGVSGAPEASEEGAHVASVATG